MKAQSSPAYQVGDKVKFVLSKESGTCHGKVIEVREELYKNYYLIQEPWCPFIKLDTEVEIPQGIIFGAS